MEKSYGKGFAIHIDPESWGAAREGGVEALTGESTGRVFSRPQLDPRFSAGERRVARCGMALTEFRSRIIEKFSPVGFFRNKTPEPAAPRNFLGFILAL
jgi:hypothetical protein